MPRTKAVVEGDVEEVEVGEFEVKERVSDGKHIKHVYREMALQEPTAAQGAWYARDIEGYLDGLIERDGWYFESAQVVGVVRAEAQGIDAGVPVLRMLYILTK